ncbi:MAG: hypothetical protein ACR2G6_12940, partial [Gemmatimonadaceae bacterium]
GGSGGVGRNLLNGRELPAKCRVLLSPGDCLSIETPGGGGWGVGKQGGVVVGGSVGIAGKPVDSRG